MLLYILSFVSGAAGMTLEMVGSRILAPYLGTTIEVWAALIGVFLGCLAVGNAWGGYLADLHDPRKALGRSLLVAALWVILTAALKDILLGFFQNILPDRRLSAVLSTFVLLGPPAIALGIVSPCAARLAIQELKTGGQAIGKIYAVSTAGGIAGTFLPGFVLFAYMGHRSILLMISGVLFACACLTRGIRIQPRLPVFIFIFLSGLSWFGLSRLEAFVKYPIRLDTDTRYNRVWITDSFYGPEQKPALIFQVNNAFDSGISKIDDKLLFEYSWTFARFRAAAPQAKKFLVVGSGCGVITHFLLKESPDNQIDAVELDPKLTDLGLKHFGFKEDPRLRVVSEDGRTFLSRSTDTYDVIFIDVFNSLTLPYHLTTREAIEKVAARLNPDGVVMVNFIAVAEGKRGALFQAMVATYKSAFNAVRVFAIRNPEEAETLQNFVLVASKQSAITIEPRSADGFALLSQEWIRPIPAVKPLTDDFAPVDYLTSTFFNEKKTLLVNPVAQTIKILIDKLRNDSKNRR